MCCFRLQARQFVHSHDKIVVDVVDTIRDISIQSKDMPVQHVFKGIDDGGGKRVPGNTTKEVWEGSATYR